MCFPFGIKYDEVSPLLDSIVTLCFPLTSFSNKTLPSFSAIIALSFAFLASNSSATLGIHR